MRKIEKVSAPWPNAFDRNRPVSSLVKALWHDSWAWKFYRYIATENHYYDPQVEQQARQVGRLLLDHSVFDPLDEWIVSAEKEPQNHDEEFRLPGVGNENLFSDWQTFLATAPWLAIGAADGLFPRNSWPWTISREIALNWAGHPKYFQQEMQRLAASRDMGPVGCLCTARLLRLWGLGGYRDVARRGLKQLSAADFRRDFARSCLPIAARQRPCIDSRKCSVSGMPETSSCWQSPC